MLIDFTPRPYQIDIFDKIKKDNSLVVLPTGLGKTAIAMMLAVHRLMMYPDSKILFLTPTKPLAEQQFESFKKHIPLNDSQYALFTGTVAPKRRHKKWLDARIIFSTPQTVENDVLGNNISLGDVSLLILDEVHRAVGDYAYVFLAQQYFEKSQHPLTLGLSASPGANKEKIEEVIQNIGAQVVEYKKPTDPDIRKFRQETIINWEQLPLSSQLTKIDTYLQQAIDKRLHEINASLQSPRLLRSFSKTSLLQLQGMLHSRISRDESSSQVYAAMSLIAQVLKLLHAQELAQTQTIHALHQYLYGLLEQSRTTKVKAVQYLVKDPLVLGALAITRECVKNNEEHPKVQKLFDKVALILHKDPQAKIIIFAQFRDSASFIQSQLSKIISCKLFFGQAKKKGVGHSQKTQKKILDDFRAGLFSCLIATSVAEEGLDIPSVDHVFFFEPIPSAIRSVQRRGRTGRHSQGSVCVLVTKNTRDETNRWVAFHKEKRMYSVLEEFSKSFAGTSQKNLTQFSSAKKMLSSKKKESNSEEKLEKNTLSQPKIIVDFREKGSLVLKQLHRENISLELKQLGVGDFLLSADCCVEFKQASDFIDSIANGRLLSQLLALVQYKKPLVIIQGDWREQSLRRVSESAVLGMLSTITVSYGIPLLYTSSPRETAKLLTTIASREQSDSSQVFTYHTAKPLTDKELLEYVVSSFPTIGGLLAQKILQRYDTLESFLLASEKDLQSIDLIGPKKAQEIVRLRKLSYKESKDTLKKGN
ncbi:MAG: ERCC4 domain-containing protein [Candidatus Nanoarchaeia archaeon]